MAMAVGATKGPRSDINITPLVDVVLVLLIIFMVLTPLMEKEIGVRVPEETPPEMLNEPPPPDLTQIVFKVDEAGIWHLNSETLTEANAQERRRGRQGQVRARGEGARYDPRLLERLDDRDDDGEHQAGGAAAGSAGGAWCTGRGAAAWGDATASDSRSSEVSGSQFRPTAGFALYSNKVVLRRMSSPLLDISRVVLRFGGVTAVSDVSFSVARGALSAIIGPNGAGKTSLLNCISGVYRPQQGRIVFDGRDITHMGPANRTRLGIARTFQNIALFRGMTVLDNLLIGRHVHQKTGTLAGGIYWGRGQKEEIRERERIEEIIDFLEIQPWRKQVVHTLAYGLQKRVELGRALALDPRLLLLDEPMAGMNAEEKEDMARYILDINEERGTTVIMIEHDMGVVMDLSHRVVVLNFGQKIADGAPEEVQSNSEVQAAYLGGQAA